MWSVGWNEFMGWDEFMVEINGLDLRGETWDIIK